jgi:hypothetical protein
MVVLMISDPENEAIATMVPLIETSQGMLIMHKDDDAFGLRKI